MMRLSAPAALAATAVLVALVAACGRTPLDLDFGELGGFGAGIGAGGPGGNNDGGIAPGGSGTAGGGGTAGDGGGGGPVICTIDQHCDDLDFCTTDRCELGACVFSDKDDDDDGYIDEVCGGFDCNDLNPNVHPNMAEVCTDAADNDCNGVADCSDPACALAANCGCIPGPAEICTNGVDDDCDTTVDCNDADCIGTPACGCTNDESGLCDDGIDNDCDDDIDCDDNDCFGSTNCQCQATPEQCDNEQDEDCDLLVDCGDPDCYGSASCSCVPPGTPEQCDDNDDDDCDDLVDCADPDCFASPDCQSCSPEVCDDGIDNDCDNKIDCADESCAFAPNCQAEPEICNNGLDDDQDQLIDCKDPDCANNPLCVQQQSNCNTAKLIGGSGTYTGDTTGNIGEHMGVCGGGAGEAVFYMVISEASYVHLDSVGTSFDSVLYVKYGDCLTGAEIACDDDSGGYQWSAKIDFPILYPGTYFVFLDGFTIDPQWGANEGPFILNVEIIPSPSEICGDGIDNDGDVYVDCADSDCTNLPICAGCNGGADPGPEFGIAACTDGDDNDCDGLTDCFDDDCSASPYAITECCNGEDQNDNGIPDDFACRCAFDSDCDGGQICYTHSVHTCGYPCDAFFGEVCPAVALGSYCNLATQQCEFL